MKSVNLIPAYRLEARRQRRRVRRWVGLCAVYTLLCVGCGVYVHMAWMPQGTWARRLDEATQQIRGIDRDLVELSGQLQAARNQLAINQAITVHPDWSGVLAVISNCLNDRVVLSRCALRGVTGVDRETPAGLEGDQPLAGLRKPKSWELYLSGLGRSLKDVSRFVLELEQTGLFDRVKLVDTRRRPFLDEQASTFNLVCYLGEAR